MTELLLRLTTPDADYRSPQGRAKVGSLSGAVGIGVNVAPMDFPPELSGIATSLSNACGRSISRTQLLAALVEELDGETCLTILEEISALEQTEFMQLTEEEFAKRMFEEA